MANSQVLAGQWNQVRGQIKKRWGQLTDDDLKLVDGNIDQLVGRIQHKTGEAREAIESFLDELTSRVHRDFAGGRVGAALRRPGGRPGSGGLRSTFGPVRPPVRHVAGNGSREPGAVGGDSLRRGRRARGCDRPGTALALGT